MSTTTSFYVYAYLDPRKPGNYQYGEYVFDHEPFYVGKGHRTERMYDHLREARGKVSGGNQKKLNKIRKIQKVTGVDPIIIKIVSGLDEETAYKNEDTVIKTIGRADLGFGPLTNLTDGGIGQKTPSEETREKMRVAKIGLYNGKDNPNYGKPRSEEVKKKISVGLKGKMAGEKNPFYGKKHSTEFKEKRSKCRTLITPNGERFELVGNFRQFLKENNLSYDMFMYWEGRGKIPDSRIGKKLQKTINSAGWEMFIKE